MFKLHLGAPAGQSYAHLSCDALMNWQHYDMAVVLERARSGTPVWPMLRRADAGLYLSRYETWKKQGLPPSDHVMLLNEPFEPMQDGFNDPASAADWTARAISAAQLAPDTTVIVMGGFLLTFSSHPMYYADIRDKVLTFAQALGETGFPIVWAFHLYFNEVMSDIDWPLRWYKAQLDAIRADFPRFAITETGFLRCGYSQRERDIMAMRQIMLSTWNMAEERDCYAYGWYMASPNRYTGQADYVLTDAAGNLRLLGHAYRDLVSAPTPPPPPPPEPDLPQLIEQLYAQAAYLQGYAQSHPSATNAELMVQLRDMLKPYMEVVEK